MIEYAEVIAARRKSQILNERENIDFKKLFEKLQLQISQVINRHTESSQVKFTICQSKSIFPLLDFSIPLVIPKIYLENKIELFEQIEDWLELFDYDYLPIVNSKKDLVGFTVSWEDQMEVEPFDFSDKLEDEVEIEE